MNPHNPHPHAITNFDQAKQEAEKLETIIGNAEAEAGMPDTVHTSPKIQEPDKEDPESAALMYIGIALIVLCVVWSCAWVVFMKRFASRKEQVQAGLLSEEALEDEEHEEEGDDTATKDESAGYSP